MQQGTKLVCLGIFSSEYQPGWSFAVRPDLSLKYAHAAVTQWDSLTWDWLIFLSFLTITYIFIRSRVGLVKFRIYHPIVICM